MGGDFGVWLRGGLVFKAQRLLYHSTLGLRVIKKKKSGVDHAALGGAVELGQHDPRHPRRLCEPSRLRNNMCHGPTYQSRPNNASIYSTLCAFIFESVRFHAKHALVHVCNIGAVELGQHDARHPRRLCKPSRLRFRSGLVFEAHRLLYHSA